MAYSDYGTIVIKNGTRIVEYSDASIKNTFGVKLETDYVHGLAGTKECFVAIYKQNAHLVVNGVVTNALGDMTELHGYRFIGTGEDFNCVNLGFSRYRKTIGSDGIVFDFKKHKNGTIQLNFTDKNGDMWKLLFGAGVGERVRQWWNIIGIKNASRKIKAL